MDGIAHRLRTAPEVFGYPRRMFSSGAGKKDLGSAQHERIGGAQALLEDLVLLFGKRTDENWRFHDHYCSALHTTYLGCALGLRPIPYGLPYTEVAREMGFMVLPEGESDAQ